MKKNVVWRGYRGILTALAVLLGTTAALQGASATTYGIGRARRFVQFGETDMAVPGTDAFVFSAFARPSGPDSILTATVEPVSGGEPLVLQPVSRTFTYLKGFSSQAALDNVFPAGGYSLALVAAGGSIEGPALLTLPDSPYPTTPRVANFSAAQTVDAGKEITLGWNRFLDAGLQDLIQIAVTDSSGTVLFQADMLGPNGPLTRTATGISIPKNTLHAGANHAVLTFTHVLGADGSSFPGATGFILQSTETHFPITTIDAVNSDDSDGSSGAVADVTTWFGRDSGTQEDFTDIVYGRQGFVAVGARGLIVFSRGDGVWQRPESGVTNDLSGIAAGLGQYVAVGGGGVLLRSPDGLSWSPAESPTDEAITCVAFGNGSFVALTGSLPLTSTNGTRWLAGDPLPAPPLSGLNAEAVAFGGGRFLAAGAGTVLESVDGRIWRRLTQSTNLFHDLAYGQGQFVAVGDNSAKLLRYPAVFRVSAEVEDGVFSLASDAGGGILSSFLKGVAFADAVWVTVGGVQFPASPFSIGTIHSAEASAGPWIDRNPTLGVWPPDTRFHVSHILKRITYGQGKFVAVGDGGALVESGTRPALEALRAAKGTGFSGVLHSSPGAVVRVRASADLRTWSAFHTVTNAAGSLQIDDPTAAADPWKFYRAEQLSP